jgi:hypothetical protein
MDMDDFLAEIAPAIDDDFLAKVTSDSWRAELADTLEPEILSATKAREWLVSQEKPTPPSIGRMVIGEQNERKRVRPRGRPTGPRPTGSTPSKMADDIACYLAVEWLKDQGVKPTPASVRVGKLMNLSPQTVIDACNREKLRLEKNPE